MSCRKACSAVLAAVAGAVFAAEAPVTQAPPVVVTATRFEERPDILPVGVTVLTAADIRRTAARSLPELLSELAGIHIRDNTGGPDFQVDLRGFGITADQNTLVLVNGQRYSEIELVSPGWSAIPFAAIERIEIMRGSGSVLYGGGATGGTINIITRAARPGERSAVLYGGAGTYGAAETRAAATLAGDRVGLALSAGWLESDNYRVNNRLRQRNAEADLRFGDAVRNVSLKFGADDQDLRNPGVRTAAQLETDRRGATTPDDFSSRNGARLDLGAARRFGDSELAANLAYRNREVRSIQSFLGAASTLTTQVDTWAFAPRLRIPFVAGGLPHTLVAGADFDHWDYDSLFSGFFDSHALATQRNSALYLQDNVELTRDTRLTLGGRLQRTENAITELLPGPATLDQVRSPRAYEIALRHRLKPGLSVFGKIGRSFRIATIDENRFQPTLLEPQTSRDIEFGAALERARVRVRVALFRIQLRNEIYFSPLFGLFGQNINLSPTRRQGLELDTQWAVTDALRAFASLAWTDAEFRSGVYGGVDVSGNEVPLVPRQTLAMGGSWRMAERTDLSLFARHVGAQRFDNDQANTFMTMPAYATLDMKLGHEMGGWSLAATLRNLTNRKYFSYGIRNAAGTSFNAYPAAERSVFLSAQYRFR
ncbi:MAG TPA: TonB-dependent receptor [Burkholderiales bacterium]|nr:TonB-dependent receptor [Burkholderiales bacterium]